MSDKLNILLIFAEERQQIFNRVLLQKYILTYTYTDLQPLIKININKEWI